VLPPPPREVVDTRNALQRWMPRIIMVPHTVMALAIISFFLLTLELAFLSSPVEGRVRSGVLLTHRKGGPVCQLTVDYRAGARAQETAVQVGEDFCRTALDASGAPLPGREALMLERVGFPFEYAQLPRSSWAELWCAVPFGGFWVVVVVLVGRQSWLKPMRERWLVRHGVELEGRVLEVKALAAKGRTGLRRELTVEYRDALGVAHQVKVLLQGSGAPEDFPVGAPMVVLADPDRPQRAVVHGHAEYRVSA